jgi:hypothetical protein
MAARGVSGRDGPILCLCGADTQLALHDVHAAFEPREIRGAGLSALLEPLNDGPRSDLDIWGRGAVRCLLRQPVAEGGIAVEAHDPDFAVETL